jgi:hypothetical protein
MFWEKRRIVPRPVLPLSDRPQFQVRENQSSAKSSLFSVNAANPTRRLPKN